MVLAFSEDGVYHKYLPTQPTPSPPIHSLHLGFTLMSFYTVLSRHTPRVYPNRVTTNRVYPTVFLYSPSKWESFAFKIWLCFITKCESLCGCFSVVLWLSSITISVYTFLLSFPTVAVSTLGLSVVLPRLLMNSCPCLTCTLHCGSADTGLGRFRILCWYCLDPLTVEWFSEGLTVSWESFW